MVVLERECERVEKEDLRWGNQGLLVVTDETSHFSRCLGLG